MLATQYQKIEVSSYEGEIISTLSDGRKVKQSFEWSIENGELEIEYSEDISNMDIIGIDREYTDEELAVLDTCIVEKSELEYQILASDDYKEALEEYKASRNIYSYYGVSPRDFFQNK
ncbi:hypothetical protein E4N95_11075 [Treponema denticola]|uniref:hypothetical protein n=1 Tax=Treponema denticola TaxID=158 RepID=UPI003D941F03